MIPVSRRTRRRFYSTMILIIIYTHLDLRGSCQAESDVLGSSGPNDLLLYG